ncbi:MAG: hypothetical protein ABIW79_05690, partial [Gemmatimonas sp.]
GAGYLAFRARAVPAGANVREATVAVLPLRSGGGDSSQAELADGLGDEIVRRLFGMTGVRVMSRRGAGDYGGRRDFDIRQAARDLGVQYVVTGSAQVVNGKWRVNATLTDSTDRGIAWVEQFERDSSQLGAMLDEIASGVGGTMQRKLGLVPATRAASSARRAIHPEALRKYIVAQDALSRRGMRIQRSVELFREVTRLDSLYAEAFSGLGLALALTPYFQPTSAQNVRGEAVASAERAIRLDPTLAQPHIALGVVHQSAYQWDRAHREFRMAISRDPRDVEARVQFGRHLLFRDSIAAGLREFIHARSQDPASALVSSWLSYAYFLSGQADSALAASNRAFKSDSTNITTVALGALVRYSMGRTEEARRLTSMLPPAQTAGMFILGALGDSATAMAELRNVMRGQPERWMSATSRAFAMLGAGDTTSALEALEQATDRREHWPSLQSVRDPLLDSVRGSARFERLLRRVGLR